MGGLIDIQKDLKKGNYISDDVTIGEDGKKPDRKKLNRFQIIMGIIAIFGFIFLVIGVMMVFFTSEQPEQILTIDRYNTTISYTLLDYNVYGNTNIRILELQHVGGMDILDINTIYILPTALPDDFILITGNIPRLHVKHDTDLLRKFKLGDKLYIYFATDGKFHLNNYVPPSDMVIDFPNGEYTFAVEDASKLNVRGGTLPMSDFSFSVRDSSTTYVRDDDSLHTVVNLASNYDTILVYGELYKTRLELTKPIRLIAPNNNATIDGGNVGAIIHIKSSDVTIQGFDIQNSGANSFIDGGIVVDQNMENVKIYHNNIHLCSNGIWLWNACGVKIYSNEVSYNDLSGIYVQNGYSNDLRYNYAHHNDYGIHIDGGDKNKIMENSVDYNKYYGIYIRDWADYLNICEYNNEGTDKNYCRYVAEREPDNVRDELKPTPAQTWVDTEKLDEYDIWLKWTTAATKKESLTWEQWIAQEMSK